MEKEQALEFLDENKEAFEALAKNERFVELSNKFAQIMEANDMTDMNSPKAMQKLATMAMKDPSLMADFMEFSQLLSENLDLKNIQDKFKM